MSRQRRTARDLRPKEPKAIIAALGDGDDVQSSLDELVLLLGNVNVPVAARVVQKRRAPDPASFIGAGKAQEIREYAEPNECTHLVVDDFITPTQKSNLQKLTGLQVWDRAFVIMKIFEQRANTAEAKLQVELAQYRYEIPSLKGLGHQMSRTGGGKRIVLKGKTAPVGVGNSRPMPSVENLNSPLIPERKGMSRGAIIGLAAGLGCGVPLLLVGIGALLFFSFAAEKTEEIASELATAQAAVMNPALAQAAQDREALKTLGESAATTATQAKARAAEAAAIVKGLAQQARRAVMPGQESWLEPSEGEAPTSMLKALQKAFAQSASLATAAKGADALRAKVDGLTATAEAPGTDTPEAIANALAEARKASEAYAKTPEAASATADMNALLAQKKGWRKTVDAARAEMEAAVKAKLAAENEAKRKAAEAAAAERAREAAQAEVASVATMETAVGEELNRFMPEAALKAFKSRSARLKSPEAKAAAEVSVERLTAYVRLKTWLVDKAAKGELASFGIASADTESVTFSGKRVPWGEFVADRQAVVFRILNTLVADDTGARALGAGERAELAVSARLFVTRYFGTETLAKSKTLRDMMDKLRTVAEALPGPKAELERVEGATPAAE